MAISSNDRLLIVAAHPDDEILGCGGMIARAVDADAAVRVVFLAEGVTARFEPAQFDFPEVRMWSERRNANAYRALAVLGVPQEQVFVQSRPCCRLDGVPLIELSKEIERHVKDFCPTRLLTLSADDPNVDHGAAFRAVLVAARPVDGSRLSAVYAFEVLSATEWNPTRPFAPTAFFDITSTIDRKVAALDAYEDEMRAPPHPRSEEVLRGLARFRGAQAGVQYAEGFALIRAIDL